MLYKAIDLNGLWQIGYSKDKYVSSDIPSVDLSPIEDAVPGYWEDMRSSFAMAPFFSILTINPEYGIQEYPMAHWAPDMALPNIIGNFFYEKSFVYDEEEGEAVLHFDGVQNAVSVWVNGTFLGRHEGYSAEFDFALSEGTLRKGENIIFMSVSNHRLEGYDGEPVSGLTSRAANECTGGITGNIEIRTYMTPLKDIAIKISEDCSEVFVNAILSEEVNLSWEISEDGKILKSGTSKGDFAFDTQGLERWSPENPKLYDLTVFCGQWNIVRQFGVRRLMADGPHFKLNGHPYYLRGICEHCYFPETIHPNHDELYYRQIVRTIKKLGFNFIRFHTYIPEEEYMLAADELGVLIQVESPNNTTVEEWKEIVRLCRKHTSVVIYCNGNEVMIDEPFIEHLSKCADYVHAETDSLYSPYSALRGLEYCFRTPEEQAKTTKAPFEHNKVRFKVVSDFADMYNSFTQCLNSYTSLESNPEEVDSWSPIYHNKPRVSHEICINGTYADLSLMRRYEGTRVGETKMFSSIEKHLKSKGLIDKAPLYFNNSCQWQRLIRKHCFEETRRSNLLAGYDFLGPIDTHWHTFGYDVGMMNEFYEMKPGESIENVLMYNSESILLTDLGTKTNFKSGERLSFNILVSYFGKKDLDDSVLTVRILENGNVIDRKLFDIKDIKSGLVSKICAFETILPEVSKPKAIKLYATLEGKETLLENKWDLYVFPDKKYNSPKNIIISEKMSADELTKAMKDGKTVVLFGTEPFLNLSTSFQIALAGRTGGNLATVIYDHPLADVIPNEGYCGWQFANLMEGGNAISFECDDVPFDPIIEVVSTHKCAIKQAALFEFKVLSGKLLVCSFNFNNDDPCAKYLKGEILNYADGAKFNPKHTLDEKQLNNLINARVIQLAVNKNLAYNENDKTANRKNK